MTGQEFSDAADFAHGYVRARTPYRTGNLARNATRREMPSDSEARIYVDWNIAPYIPYVNEPWISPRWGGKKNPNESYWNDTAEALVYELAEYIGGEVVEE